MDTDHQPEWQPTTMPEALARSLRDMMMVSGQPNPRDYLHDRILYDEHRRQWDQAKAALEWFNREQAAGTTNV